MREKKKKKNKNMTESEVQKYESMNERKIKKEKTKI